MPSQLAMFDYQRVTLIKSSTDNPHEENDVNPEKLTITLDGGVVTKIGLPLVLILGVSIIIYPYKKYPIYVS